MTVKKLKIFRCETIVGLELNDSLALKQGDTLPDCGLVGTLDNRLLRIIVFLALRRRTSGSDNGWVSAKDIAHTVEQNTMGAVQKFLQRHLQPYRKEIIDIDNLSSHLIQYKPSSKRYVDINEDIPGFGLGPYRIGINPKFIELNVNECWQFILYGQVEDSNIEENKPLLEEILSPDSLFRIIELYQSGGNILAICYELEQKIKNILLRQVPSSQSINIHSLAEHLAFLGKIKYQLGQAESSIALSRRARRLFEDKPKDLANISETFNIEANALGQRERRFAAITANTRAIYEIDKMSRPSERSKVFTKLMYIASLGQQYSAHGNFVTARVKLESVLHKLDSSASNDSVYNESRVIILARLVQNELRTNNPNRKSLENQVRDLNDARFAAEDVLHAPVDILYQRTLARYFLLHTEQYNEGLYFAKNAFKIAEVNGMQRSQQQLEKLLQTYNKNRLKKV